MKYFEKEILWKIKQPNDFFPTRKNIIHNLFLNFFRCFDDRDSWDDPIIF